MYFRLCLMIFFFFYYFIFIHFFVEPQWIYSVLARSRRSLMNFDMSEGGRLQTDSNLCKKQRMLSHGIKRETTWSG